MEDKDIWQYAGTLAKEYKVTLHKFLWEWDLSLLKISIKHEITDTHFFCQLLYRTSLDEYNRTNIAHIYG